MLPPHETTANYAAAPSPSHLLRRRRWKRPVFELADARERPSQGCRTDRLLDPVQTRPEGAGPQAAPQITKITQWELFLVGLGPWNLPSLADAFQQTPSVRRPYGRQADGSGLAFHAEPWARAKRRSVGARPR